LEYGIGHRGDELFIVTNWKAKNFRLMKTSLDQTDKNHWVEVIPHREDVLLEDLEMFDDI
jgi:oligopeptidase B